MESMSKSLDNVIIKPANQSMSMTIKQMQEFARCADPVNGPHYFLSNFMYIQHPTLGRILYKPYEYQKRLIDVYHNYRKSVSLLPRQSGKCVQGDTTFVNIKNKHTGEIRRVSLADLYEMQRASSNNY